MENPIQFMLENDLGAWLFVIITIIKLTTK